MSNILKCDDCGLIFAEDEIATWEEERGEYGGIPAYEKMAGCPRCHSTSIDDFEENEENER